MTSRLTRVLRRMAGLSAPSSWRPQGLDVLFPLSLPDVPAEPDGVAPRDGSSSDLRDRQRDLAYDMYAEALLRMTEADMAEHRRDERASA